MPSKLSTLLMTLMIVTIESVLQAVATSDIGIYYAIQRNMSLISDATIMELQTRTEFSCVSECRFHCACLSVNVNAMNTAGYRCTMFSVTQLQEGAVLREEPGASYMEIATESETEDEDCETKMKEGFTSNAVCSFVRTIHGSITTFCDMQTGTGGWTMIQRRMDGSVDFYRGWQEYKDGFGDPGGEFWLGLDAIHDLIKSGEYTLRFDLWDDTEHRFAEYKNATVADEADDYRLDYASYTGTAGDSMYLHSKGTSFSTYDQDNDGKDFNCAERYEGGWWYRACYKSHLNGPYLNGSTISPWTGMIWYQFRGESYSLLRTEIKVKRV